MSLLHRVKEGIKQRHEKGKQEKKERKTIDREAQAKAHQEYLKAYRQERMKAVTSSVREKAKRDAMGGYGIRGGLKSVGGGLKSAGKTAKPALNFLSGAGQNLLKSDQFNIGMPDFASMGVPGFESKKPLAPKPRQTKHKKTHPQKKEEKKPVKIFNPLDF